MSYTKTTDFAAKDALPLNNAGTYVKGTEIGVEFDNIAIADALNVKTTALGTGVETFLGTPSSANLAAAVTGETGTGALVFATSPTLVTPALGTPASGTLTSCTGLPAAGVVGTALVAAAIGTTVQAYDAQLDTWATVTPGTNVATALAVNIGSAGAPVLFNGALGTPNAGTLTNCSGYPVVTLGTPQASTSGSSIDFTSIPAGVKKITINLAGVSLNGTDHLLIQIGDSGGLETSGYLGASAAIVNAGATACANSTAGFIVLDGAAANVLHGSITLNLLSASAFTWASTHSIGASNSTLVMTGGGSKSLSAELDRVSVTVTGSNTFDAGAINISYE